MLEQKLKGLRIELISDDVVSTYAFSNSDNYVSATIGVKNGPLAGLLYQYDIIDDASIIIYGDSSSSIKLEAMEFGLNELSLICNGNREIYRTNID